MLRELDQQTEAAPRERLLDSAEKMFAEHGWAATSMRQLTAAAECNLAAANYYFGSKDGLYLEVFRRRMRQLRDRRLESIREVMRGGGGRPSLERLLATFTGAFLEPYVSGEGRLWMQLVSRELVDPRLPPGFFVEEMIGPVHDELAAALMRVCPGLGEEPARRSTHSLVGQLVHFMHVERCFKDAGSWRGAILEPAELTGHIVAFSAAGIHALARAGGRSGTRGTSGATSGARTAS